MDILLSGAIQTTIHLVETLKSFAKLQTSSESKMKTPHQLSCTKLMALSIAQTLPLSQLILTVTVVKSLETFQATTAPPSQHSISPSSAERPESQGGTLGKPIGRNLEQTLKKI